MRASALALSVLLLAPAARAAPLSDDPGRGHYLMAPTAFLLRGGEAVLAQTEVFLSSATVGIADHVDLTAGSAVPALRAAGADTSNLELGLKAGFSPTRLVHLAAGFESLSFPGATAGFTFGVVTYGRESLNASVGMGLPALIAANAPGFGPMFTYFGGTVALGRHFALATENWWFPTRPSLPFVNAGLARVMLWRLSLGVGAVRIAPLRIPLPWVELSMRVFG